MACRTKRSLKHEKKDEYTMQIIPIETIHLKTGNYLQARYHVPAKWVKNSLVITITALVLLALIAKTYNPILTLLVGGAACLLTIKYQRLKELEKFTPLEDTRLIAQCFRQIVIQPLFELQEEVHPCEWYLAVSRCTKNDICIIDIQTMLLLDENLPIVKEHIESFNYINENAPRIYAALKRLRAFIDSV